jgi:hypothetical protein
MDKRLWLAWPMVWGQVHVASLAYGEALVASLAYSRIYESYVRQCWSACGNWNRH